MSIASGALLAQDQGPPRRAERLDALAVASLRTADAALAAIAEIEPPGQGA